MPKTGHYLDSLLPDFPVEVGQKLAQKFSIGTAEELLGLAVTQDVFSFAEALDVAPKKLRRALQIARNVVEPEFLLELAAPIEKYSAGALIDREYKLPENLARHLQKG